MSENETIEELQEKVYVIEKQLQEIADLKIEVADLTEKKNALNKQITVLKSSIEQKEKVLITPYMEKSDPQQTIQFEEPNKN